MASVAVLAVALMPSSASAQGPPVCDGTLTGEGNRAELSFECNFDVTTLEIAANKDVLLSPGQGDEGPEGFICVPPAAQGPDSGQGQPNNFGDPTPCTGNLTAGNRATGTVLAQDACDPLALRITAAGPSNGAGPSDTFIVRIQGCPGDDGGPDGGGGGNGGGDPDEDSGTTPSGGVQSGAGGTADDGGSALMPVGLGLILAGTLGLGAVGLVRRRA